MEEFYTKKQISEMFPVSQATLSHYVQTGQLKPYRLSGRLFFTVKQILSFMQRDTKKQQERDELERKIDQKRLNKHLKRLERP